RRSLRQLARELEALKRVDFFPGGGQGEADNALSILESAINEQFSPNEPSPARGTVATRARADYRNRLWATRRRLWVDRVASAWLIHRFIDPHAQFLWLDRPEDCPPEALGFDFDGATFTHIGERVTFEVLLASFGLETDAPLRRLGALIHYLDVGGAPVPEAAGFEGVLAGMRERCADDDELLACVAPVLEALYGSFQAAARRRGEEKERE
ncbi:MAG: chromate resistance protein, partial [Gammaproteobacteria bacterium]|nr:chromate resistance protein [Gammaproteobacteria bacterium]NIR85400.1 chromate resistance protein [Gammaproteobacteria bacterium]NIU03306.1 chromate resistance protein [Gammaproteobacteria bacterium]NIV50800.1 hypothetical protein [Gammaproteobacteria bacterium]NIX06427.1 hypothetical protein [Gammaproteobacteria bacterium]